MGHVLTRRALLGGFATFPLVAIVSSPPLLAACGSKPPETPLAHLYGKEWVQGAFKLYAGRYADVQTSAEQSSVDVYRVLAQKGIVALDALQSRDVPFRLRVDEATKSFKVERNVPERLMFTADMNDADRRAAELAWKKARDHVHTDYEEIRRLDHSLTTLFGQVRTVRNAIEEGRIEQYRIVEQLTDLKKDPTQLPYALPYQVTQKDYEDILLLLLERLEDDRGRLAAIEADIIAVGTTVRATDANSATMATSIRKMLLAVVKDGTTEPRGPLYPEKEEDKAKYVATAAALRAKIEASPEFARWRKDEREKKLAAFGSFLQLLDQMTGLPTSQVYRTVLDIWRGDQDYLQYLKTVASLVPHGGAVAQTIAEALEYTDKARKIAGNVAGVVKAASSASSEALVEKATAEAKGVVLNTGSRFAVDRVQKQLSFFKDKLEVDRVTQLLGETDLVKVPIPAGIPGLPSGG